MIDKELKVIINILKTIGLIFLLIFWNSIPVLLLSLNNINYNNLPKIYKIIILLISEISLIIVYLLMYRKTIIRDFKNYFSKDLFKNFKISLKYWYIGLMIMIMSNLIISLVYPGSIATNEETVRELIDKAPLFMIFEVALFAPITEELIFRKSIKDITNNKYLYLLLSGIIFGAMHVIGSMENPLDLLYLIPYSTLGIAFAALYYKTGNIFSTISVHAIHNTITLVLYLVSKSVL